MIYSLHMSVEQNKDLYFAGPLFSVAEKNSTNNLQKD